MSNYLYTFQKCANSASEFQPTIGTGYGYNIASFGSYNQEAAKQRKIAAHQFNS